MSMLVEYSIPIPDYYGTDVFFQTIFVECKNNRSLTIDELLPLLAAKNAEEEVMSEEHPEWGPYTFPYKACLESLRYLIDSLPVVTKKGLVQSNSFVEKPGLGKHPLTVRIINPFKFDVVSQNYNQTK